MFESFYHMTSTPFSRAIPADKLYESLPMDEILGRLTYAAERQLFAVLTGDCGTGKTTTIRRFSQELDHTHYRVLYLSDSKLTPRHFYKGLLEQLGCEAKFYRGDAKRQLHHEIELMRGSTKNKNESLSKQVYILSVDSGAFFTDEEKEIYDEQIAETQVKNELLSMIDPESSSYYGNFQRVANNHIKNTKMKLKEEFNNCLDIRKLRDDALYYINKDGEKIQRQKNIISIFDSSLVRMLDASYKKGDINYDILIVRNFHEGLRDDLIKRGFNWDGDHYIFLTCSAGQIRKKKMLMIKQLYLMKLKINSLPD